MANMSTTVTLGSVAAAPITGDVKRFLTGLEVTAFFASILLYIWHWQRTAPHVWILLLTLMVATHFLHHDTLRNLGLGRRELRSNAQVALPLMLALFVPLVVYGFVVGRLKLLVPDLRGFEYLAGYGFWCACQQYLTQSYFHNRLMSVIRNPHLCALMVGVMFGAAHIPNPVLMAVTTVAGFIFSEVFARHRNIWPLAFAQAVGGILVAAITPPWLIHNMRVGPGYLYWGIQ